MTVNPIVQYELQCAVEDLTTFAYALAADELEHKHLRDFYRTNRDTLRRVFCDDKLIKFQYDTFTALKNKQIELFQLMVEILKLRVLRFRGEIVIYN